MEWIATAVPLGDVLGNTPKAVKCCKMGGLGRIIGILGWPQHVTQSLIHLIARTGKSPRLHVAGLQRRCSLPTATLVYFAYPKPLEEARGLTSNLVRKCWSGSSGSTLLILSRHKAALTYSKSRKLLRRLVFKITGIIVENLRELIRFHVKDCMRFSKMLLSHANSQ